MKNKALLAQVAHRPWPLPTGPWTMTQRWRDLLFAHWPLPVATVRQLVPPPLNIDTFAGQAWISLVPFRMANVHARFLPALPWFSAFPQLNIRTYVTARDPQNPRPGVYFFSIDAANPLAVTLARRNFHLPYYNARMQLRADGNLIHYQSRRTHANAAHAEFVGAYEPSGAVEYATPGTLDHWLTERYALYTIDPRGRALIGEIHHLPWPIQPARADFTINTVTADLPLPESQPLLHFSRRLDVLVWPLRSAE